MYLGIDLGTSSLKLVIIDDTSVIEQTSVALVVDQPQLLWSEQNPHDWWAALIKAMQQLSLKQPKAFAAVKAIGLSGQQHGAVLLNDKGEVLRSAILWNDGRSMAQCQQLEATVPDFAEITGNRIMPGFTAPKLAWVAEHEPEIFKQVAKVLLPKDYLRYKLAGYYASDMSDASGTSWLNVKERCWSDKMLAACDLTNANMPELFEGTQLTGKINPELAVQWGLSKDVVIAAGAGDNAAAAVSIDAIKSGNGFLSVGTSGTYFISDDAYHPNVSAGVHTFCHCVPERWHQMNCHLSAASALSWWSDTLGQDVPHLVQAAEQHGVVTQTPLFIPYLSGERSPHNDPTAKAAFIGLTHQTSQAAMTQAVLEGVALNFDEGQLAMQAVGAEVNQVAIVGGGARSEYWSKIMASAINKPLILYENRDVGAALGAAKLAYMAYNELQAEELTAPIVTGVVEPDPVWHDILQTKLATFSQLYAALQFTFKEDENNG